MISKSSVTAAILPGDVVVQLMGGLGNQMFQVATGFAVAHRQGGRLWLDGRALPLVARRKDTTQRTIEVTDFKISAQVASGAELQRVGFGWSLLPPPHPWIAHGAWAILRRGVQSFSDSRHEIRREAALGYEQIMQDLDPNSIVYLIGYWQSALYFGEFRQELRKQFVPAASMPSALADLREQIASQHSLVMHVRRGDFVTNQSAQRFHGVLPKAYYNAAFLHLRKHLHIEHTYVFTEDPQWCHHELQGLGPRTIVSSSRFSGTSSHHLYAMTAGKAFVLANSSFSWWAAWLSEALPGNITAPSTWYAGRRDIDGPVLQGWTRM